MSLPKILAYTHQVIGEVLSVGGIAIDATVGNGYDTLFLAKQVGSQGRVYGFDIQQTAISITRKRLIEHHASEQVELFLNNHALLHQDIPLVYKGKIGAIMFNLGYLPNGDHQIITTAHTTQYAAEQASEWLMKGGRMTLVLYTGHSGGEAEASTVINWASSLPTKQFRVDWYQILNRHQAPSILIIEKNT
ncbi:Putative rRNA methylase [Seinonella peptonophila]|uniref:Putative rRNA methylase n=1 Tax=Seinonella peptonophila TaxID=112248 RepID=A0A1M5AIZ6_9BACL|nr:class I SAM-dependent methyltransferase [Seinonella peptonophila]SHF30248.1 Putative rRNA methylase [Seinonella peptonophila]